MPSFVDADRAMQDPLVRERVTAPAQPTSPDLQLANRLGGGTELHKGSPDIWYLRYRDSNGRWCKAKATTQQVLQRLRERRFSHEIEASHHHNGGFQPLVEFAEFHSAATEAAKRRGKRRTGPARAGDADGADPLTELATASPTMPRWWIVAGVAAVALVVGAGVLARLLL
jgi:hypothetical protein